MTRTRLTLPQQIEYNQWLEDRCESEGIRKTSIDKICSWLFSNSHLSAKKYDEIVSRSPTTRIALTLPEQTTYNVWLDDCCKSEKVPSSIPSIGSWLVLNSHLSADQFDEIKG